MDYSEWSIYSTNFPDLYSGNPMDVFKQDKNGKNDKNIKKSIKKNKKSNNSIKKLEEKQLNDATTYSVLQPEYIQDSLNDLPEPIAPPDNILDSTFCMNNYNKNILVDLDKIVESSEIVNFTNIKMDIALNIYNIPCILSYNNIPLNVIEFISKGAFGSVLKYSNITKLPDNWVELSNNMGGTYYKNNITNEEVSVRPRNVQDKYYEVAVKTYNNNNDPELKIVELLGDSIGMCNTVNTRILSVSNYIHRFIYNILGKSKKNIAIMDIMDGTLQYFKENTKLNINEIKSVIYNISMNLICLLPEYIYTDIKLQNILYKCYKYNDDMGKIKIILGDLGSICLNGHTNTCTYPPPESIIDPAKTICSESTMVWDIGVIFLDLIGYKVNKFFYWNSNIINECINSPNPENKYIELVNTEILNIIRYFNLNDYELLLKGIFTINNDRITLQQICDFIK